jgi:hypothetical protein
MNSQTGSVNVNLRNCTKNEKLIMDHIIALFSCERWSLTNFSNIYILARVAYLALRDNAKIFDYKYEFWGQNNIH